MAHREVVVQKLTKVVSTATRGQFLCLACWVFIRFSPETWDSGWGGYGLLPRMCVKKQVNNAQSKLLPWSWSEVNITLVSHCKTIDKVSHVCVLSFLCTYVDHIQGRGKWEPCIGQQGQREPQREQRYAHEPVVSGTATPLDQRDVLQPDTDLHQDALWTAGMLKIIKQYCT